MTILWRDLRDRILYGLLVPYTDPTASESVIARYSYEQMLVWARWACAEISMHTAEEASFTLTLTGRVFSLPQDAVDPISKAGVVVYKTNNQEEVLQPISRHPSLLRTKVKGFWSSPTQVTLTFEPAANSQATVYYFKVWDAPTDDTSLLKFPSWMELPFSYLVAAYAQAPSGSQSANVRQWNRRVDSGTPEDNSLNDMARFFIQQAYRVLHLHPAQDREFAFEFQPDAEHL